MSEQRVALVTGASSGIGLASAQELARRGFHVFGTSRAPDERPTPADARKIEMLALDVADGASVAACIQAVAQRAGHIDVLVNNAGYALLGAVEETSEAEAHAVFETDFFGAARMTQATLSLMRQQGSGVIIFMGVILGQIGQPFGAYLSAAKHALEGFAESLRYEAQPFGVAVSIVEPQFVASNAGRHMRTAAGALPAYAAVRERVIARFAHDVQHGLPPQQVAQVVAHIAMSRSPRLRYPVGAQARIVPTLKHMLPEGIFASVARNAYGLD